MNLLHNILPISLIIVGIYSILYVYLKELDTFEIVEGFKQYNERTFATKDDLLLGDTFIVKNNIGLGNKNYLSSKDMFDNTEKNKNNKENNSPDNNNCIPFELCNSFYGSNYATI